MCGFLRKIVLQLDKEILVFRFSKTPIFLMHESHVQDKRRIAGPQCEEIRGKKKNFVVLCSKSFLGFTLLDPKKWFCASDRREEQTYMGDFDLHTSLVRFLGGSAQGHEAALRNPAPKSRQSIVNFGVNPKQEIVY